MDLLRKTPRVSTPCSYELVMCARAANLIVHLPGLGSLYTPSPKRTPLLHLLVTGLCMHKMADFCGCKGPVT